MLFLRSRRPRRGESHFDIDLAAALGPPPPALGGLSDLLPVRANGVRSGVLVFEPGVFGGVTFSCATYFLRIRPPTCVAPPGSFFFCRYTRPFEHGRETFPRFNLPHHVVC